ncbi:MAG: hypothetical protein ACKO96_43885, partial [Flammeovirgaceae bacterium]
MTLLFFGAIFLIIDYYFFQGVVTVSKNWSALWRATARSAFWIPTIFTFVALLWWGFGDPYRYSANFRNWMLTGIVAAY